MIKRDTIQRVILNVGEDGQGGNPTTREMKEIVRAHVSVSATANQLTQQGVKEEMMLNVITDIKLDEYIYARYLYSDKLFKIMRQVKIGNEYFSVLKETTE